MRDALFKLVWGTAGGGSDKEDGQGFLLWWPDSVPVEGGDSTSFIPILLPMFSSGPKREGLVSLPIPEFKVSV